MSSAYDIVLLNEMWTKEFGVKTQRLHKILRSSLYECKRNIMAHQSDYHTLIL